MAEALPAATEPVPRARAVEDAGAAALAFPELVYAHFEWHRSTSSDDASAEVELRYRRALERFERKHGAIVESYWCTEVPSAVVLASAPAQTLSRHRSPKLSLHRLTDWVTKGQPDLAFEIQRCDELGVKASAVLTGVRHRICMHLVMASASHLLSLVEARARPDEKDELQAGLRRERERVDAVTDYYASAANGQAQIVYFVGMAAVAVALGALSAVLAFATGDRYAFGALAAGSVGAVVSVLQRISSRDFALDYDVGRHYVLFLGGLRPVLGAVFGLAVYYAFTSGLIALDLPGDTGSSKGFYAILVLAFVAGFNERWAQDTLATASGMAAQQAPGPSGGVTKRPDAPPAPRV